MKAYLDFWTMVALCIAGPALFGIVVTVAK
jgi:ABC-type uncharacterized transport system permease subunit